MRRRIPSLVLWLTLMVCAPLPFFFVEVGRQPVAALMQMLAVTLSLIATEGSSGAVTLAAWILGVQVALGMVVLAVATLVVTRLFERSFGRRSEAAMFVLVAAILAVAIREPIYRTPFRAAGLYATLGEVFE